LLKAGERKSARGRIEMAQNNLKYDCTLFAYENVVREVRRWIEAQ